MEPLPQTGARCSERTTGLIRTRLSSSLRNCTASLAGSQYYGQHATAYRHWVSQNGLVFARTSTDGQHATAYRHWVRRYIKDKPAIMAIALSVATPDLSAREEYWHQLKQNGGLNALRGRRCNEERNIRVYPYLQA